MADVITAGGGGRSPGTPLTYSPIAAVDLRPGTPVAPSLTEASEVQPASWPGGDFANPTGIVVTQATAGHRALVQCAGPLSLPTQDWDAATGGSGGLTTGLPYYLGEDPGQLTTT